MSLTRAEALGLIPPQKIAFDQKNPRGETKEQIEQDIEFKRLRKSVKHNNLFQPVIVRANRSKKQPYRLVDGERRLRAALLEKSELVPVRIIEGGEREGRIAAYNIHTLRKEWDKRIEVAAIREIIDEIKQKKKNITEAELFKELREITNHKEHDLKTLLALLKYDAVTIKKVQDGALAMSYLVQIDSSFLAPLKREFPKLYEQYGDSKLRKILVRKAEDGRLGNTRYLMDNVLKYFKDSDDGRYIFSENKVKLKRVLKKFLEEPEQNVSIIVDKMAEPKKTKKKRKAKKTKRGKAAKAKGTVVPAEVDQQGKLLTIEQNVINNHIFDLVFNYLRGSIIEFEKRAKIKFENEPELQNFIYSVFRALFSSVEFEDPTEKMCEKSNRLDFVLKDHKIIIEVKYVRDKTHAKKISEELSADYLRYKQSPYGQTIINYIYDPNNHITNHDLYKKQLNKILCDAHNYTQ